jgi:hypothetical protein
MRLKMKTPLAIKAVGRAAHFISPFDPKFVAKALKTPLRELPADSPEWHVRQFILWKTGKIPDELKKTIPWRSYRKVLNARSESEMWMKHLGPWEPIRRILEKYGKVAYGFTGIEPIPMAARRRHIDGWMATGKRKIEETACLRQHQIYRRSFESKLQDMTHRFIENVAFAEGLHTDAQERITNDVLALTHTFGGGELAERVQKRIIREHPGVKFARYEQRIPEIERERRTKG